MQVQQVHGIKLGIMNNVIWAFSNIHLLISLKIISYLLFVQRKKTSSNIHDPIGPSIPLLFESELKPFEESQNCHEFDDIPSDKCLCNHGIEDTINFLFRAPFSLLKEQHSELL